MDGSRCKKTKEINVTYARNQPIISLVIKLILFEMRENKRGLRSKVVVMGFGTRKLHEAK